MGPTISTKDAREAFRVFGHTPSVGKSLSVKLWKLGFRSMEQLAQGDPEGMFEEPCRLAAGFPTRCSRMRNAPRQSLIWT